MNRFTQKNIYLDDSRYMPYEDGFSYVNSRIKLYNSYNKMAKDFRVRYDGTVDSMEDILMSSFFISSNDLMTAADSSKFFPGILRRQNVFKELPIKFGNINGGFVSEFLDIQTLKNFPDKCSVLNISEYCLETLEGMPQECQYVHISESAITNLNGSVDVCKRFTLSSVNCLISLEGAPSKVEYFSLLNCKSLKFLKGFPLCDDLMIKNTLFDVIVNKLGNDQFREFAVRVTDEETQDMMLIDFVKEGKLKREDVVDLMISEKGKYYFRGTIVARNYGF